MKRVTSIVLVLLMVLGMMLTACASDADVASQNLSQAAEQFEIPRRVVFYNGITEYELYFKLY